MSLPQPPKPSKLVIGVLINNKALLPEVAHELKQGFGAVDLISPWMDFDFTNYYAAEMGKPLYRRMMAFRELIAQKDLVRIKLHTNELELKYASEGRRHVNIDPGYLLYERFVLATGKNFTHRIYIDQGIYADLTLIYQKGNFQKLPWTYPDYAETRMAHFLLQVRQKYASDLQRFANMSKATAP